MRQQAHTIELSKLNELFYSSDGILFWKRNFKIAGSPNKGYLRVNIDGTLYQVHRIIYQMHHGLEILDQSILIDHIDGNTINNRSENLRSCTNSENLRNRKTNKNNTSGHKNIYHAKEGKYQYWQVRICVDGVNHKARFPFTEEGLASALLYRDQLLKELHGDFASNGTTIHHI